ncbi:MAG: GDP-mannose 4,6-dehydratase, partial [Rikenellaceae bacterium]
GNLSAERDWGHAKDYIKAMYLILQQDKPDDYVIATGVTTRVREFVRMAFAFIGLELEFKGEGVKEKGVLKAIRSDIFTNRVGSEYLEAIQKRIGETIIAVDPQYFRPTEVELLMGNPTKSRTVLGWVPEYDLKGLIEDMMISDVKLMKKDAYLKAGGYQTLNYFE